MFFCKIVNDYYMFEIHNNWQGLFGEKSMEDLKSEIWRKIKSLPVPSNSSWKYKDLLITYLPSKFNFDYVLQIDN